MQKEVSECRAMSRLELESMQRQMAARQEDVEDAQRQSTAYYNTLEVRGKSSKPSLLLFKGGLFDNMYHLWHRFSEQINLANVHSPQI